LRTYVVDHGPDKLDVLVGAVRRIWGDQPPAQTLLGVAGLALPDMRFEVDAVAARPQ
jgi:enamine deaminase RidA (YjgF/YER057c/UK114 family)